MGAAKKRARSTGTAGDGFTAEEKATMAERAAEATASRTKRGKKDPEAEVLAKIAEMPDADRAIAEALHATVCEHAPDLVPRTWYGMPAYARDGSVVCFLQVASKFKTRYCTLGFSDTATLDDGEMWETAFAHRLDPCGAKARGGVARTGQPLTVSQRRVALTGPDGRRLRPGYAPRRSIATLMSETSVATTRASRRAG